MYWLCNPREVSNGRVDYLRSNGDTEFVVDLRYPRGTGAVLTCNSNFVPVNRQWLAKCQSDGRWNRNLKCERKNIEDTNLF